jgi:glyoxylase I family protein
MTILGIHHISITVSSLETARMFYEGFLGLTALVQRPDKPFDGVWYTAGQQQIHLIVAKGESKGDEAMGYPGQQPHMALHIDDLTNVQLKANAWGIDLTPSRSGRPVVFVRDPDGNVMELIEVPKDEVKRR